MRSAYPIPRGRQPGVPRERLRSHPSNLIRLVPAKGGSEVREQTQSWGVEPVPQQLHVLSGLDSTLLWGNLSVSLLVIVIGALLVPALSLRAALLAILVGAVAGNVLLAVAALIGADARVPGMVLLRAPLGRRGSYLPTGLNVAQNVGWSTFELIIIATAAGAASQHLFHWQGRWFWTLVFGVLSWALGMLGPIGFVRRYLRKVASWALLFSMAYLTYWAISKSHLHAFWAAPGKGGFPSFGQAVDLVIGSVVSWTPLAADYTRFSRTRRDSCSSEAATLAACSRSALTVSHSAKLPSKSVMCRSCRIHTRFASALSSARSWLTRNTVPS